MRKYRGYLLIATVFIIAVITIIRMTVNQTAFPVKYQSSLDYSKLVRTSYQLDSGEIIDVVYNKMESRENVILYFHGNAGRLQYIIDHLNLNHSFVAPSYPGYQGSSGKASVKKLL